MTIALVDNGSLEPAAHLNLRRVAGEISRQAGRPVEAVSWRHSDRIAASRLNHKPGVILADWISAQLARGEREFLFVPFFISAQGAIGSALRLEIEHLRQTLGAFEFHFTAGLAARDALVPILVDRIRETILRHHLDRPAAIIVDHGGPSAASAALRDEMAQRVSAVLVNEVPLLAAASLEGAEHTHNLPLIASLLATHDFNRGDVVVAPLFLAPGRHAGPDGDLENVIRNAQNQARPLRCHLADVIGTHPVVVEALAGSLRDALEPGPPRPGPR